VWDHLGCLSFTSRHLGTLSFGEVVCSRGSEHTALTYQTWETGVEAITLVMASQPRFYCRQAIKGDRENSRIWIVMHQKSGYPIARRPRVRSSPASRRSGFDFDAAVQTCSTRGQAEVQDAEIIFATASDL